MFGLSTGAGVFCSVSLHLSRITSMPPSSLILSEDVDSGLDENVWVCRPRESRKLFEDRDPDWMHHIQDTDPPLGHPNQTFLGKVYVTRLVVLYFVRRARTLEIVLSWTSRIAKRSSCEEKSRAE